MVVTAIVVPGATVDDVVTTGKVVVEAIDEVVVEVATDVVVGATVVVVGAAVVVVVVAVVVVVVALTTAFTGYPAIPLSIAGVDLVAVESAERFPFPHL